MEKTDLLQGTLDMLILKVLQREATRGFGICQRIHKLSEEVLRVGEGSLYRPQSQGWIESEWGQSDNNRKAKFYRLTKAGRKQLERENEGWEHMCVAIRRVIQST